MRIIPVEQVQGEFYGGYAYRVSWSFNGESQPSTLTVDVVNEDGDYSTPSLSLASIKTVSLGGFTFNGYLVGYSLNASAEQKTLTLEYVDQSIMLDRYWVGLKDIHPETTNVILVGKQYHPCDVNMDSSIDYEEEESRLIDPCDPCPFSPVDKYKEACDPRIKDIETLETYYTFSELISQVKSNVSNMTLNYDASNLYMYKAQHVGNLRSVLSSWCSDLGLSFFWDPTADELIFNSRASFGENAPVSYSDIKNNPDAVEVNYRENILNTFSQGFIGRFERPGKFVKYQCRQDTWKMLRPITLDDLFLPDPEPVSSKYSGQVSARSVAVALSYYSSSLRDAFLWFIYYGILKPSDLEAYIDGDDDNEGDTDDGSDTDDDQTPEPEPDTNEDTGYDRETITAENGSVTSGGSGSGSGTTVGNTFQASIESVDPAIFEYSTGDDCGTIHTISATGTSDNSASVLSHWGGMKIRAVYHINSSNSNDKANFYKCRNNMPPELVQVYMGSDGSYDDPKFYFFVAESSEEGYDESISADRNLASNFLGKYHFNKFRTIITGASDDETECNIQGPSEDGSGRWHKAKQGVENIEIFKFGHDVGSMIDNLKTSMVEDIDENTSTEDERIQTSGSNKQPENYVANSFILFSRSAPKWYPEREYGDKWYGELYAWCNQQIPHKYANSDGRPDILYTMFPEAKWNENIRLFMVKEVDSLTVDVEKVDHEKEILGGYKMRIEEDDFGNQFKINEGPWGLMSTECFQINFDGGAMIIFTPPGSFIEELENYEDECVTAPSYSLLSEELYDPVTTSYTGPGYRVFASCSSEFPKFTAKFEHTVKIDAPDATEVRKVDYVDYQLSEENIAIFGNECEPDRGILSDYLLDVGSTSEYSYSDPLYDINFKLAGVVPEIWSVKEGLSSMSVEVSENGAFTTYNLSTKIIQPPSVSYTEQNLRFSRRAAFGNKLGTMTSVAVKTIRH
jgi:hypothetical protein